MKRNCVDYTGRVYFTALDADGSVVDTTLTEDEADTMTQDVPKKTYPIALYAVSGVIILILVAASVRIAFKIKELIGRKQS